MVRTSSKGFKKRIFKNGETSPLRGISPRGYIPEMGIHPLFGYFYGGYPRGYQKRGYPGITANTNFYLSLFYILRIFR